MTTYERPPSPFCRHCSQVVHERADGVLVHSATGRAECAPPHESKAERRDP
jgi:hypothetical protein